MSAIQLIKLVPKPNFLHRARSDFSITSDKTVPSDIEKSVAKVFAYRGF